MRDVIGVIKDVVDLLHDVTTSRFDVIRITERGMFFKPRRDALGGSYAAQNTLPTMIVSETEASEQNFQILMA
ncbi:hypothetical protein AA16663_2082 [Komagataeibacter rhaeticus DSM 16663]|uniref:hypothetical protein n=1 Tax=Komagataeibacter oboediens TaxID=65958 RepID=UPI0021567DFE|nr:hypothetical protein AA16663_2082 [Komagataeibacter rhaeticus DSM 16663]